MNESKIKESIKIPDNLDNYILNGIEKGRLEKGNINIKSRLGSISKIAGIVTVAGIGLAVINPGIVRAIPIIGQVLSGFDSSNFGEPIDKYVSYSKGVELVSENKDAKVTLNDVIVDENMFLFAFTIESDVLKGFEGKNPHDFINVDSYVTLNGEGISSIGHSARKIDDNKGAIILKGNIAELGIKDDIKVKISIDSIRGASGEAIGNWNFKLKTNKVENSKRIKLEEKYDVKGQQIVINEIVMSPLRNTIIMVGKDNGTMFSAKYKVIDDKGNILRTDFRDSRLDNIIGEYVTKLEVLNDLSNTKYIDIIPYWGSETIDKTIEDISVEMLTTTGSGEREELLISRKPTKEELNNGYALSSVYYNLSIDKEREFLGIDELKDYEIEVNDKDKVKIKGMQINDDNTKVILSIDGDYNYSYLSQLVIFDEDMNDIGSWEGHIGAVIEDDEEGIYSITLDKLDSSKKYKVAIPLTKNIDLNSKYKMRLNLK